MRPGAGRPGMRPADIGRFIDAQNAAFADRNLYMADPDFVDAPQAGFADKAYARSRRVELSAAFPCSSGPQHCSWGPKHT